MKRTRYHFTLVTSHSTLNGTTVSRVAETEARARESILRIVREAAPDATLKPVRRCMDSNSKLHD